MSQPLTVGLPVDLDLGSGYSVRITVLDATTGALVAGANINTVVITAEPLAGGTQGLAQGEWLLVPGVNA